MYTESEGVSMKIKSYRDTWGYAKQHFTHNVGRQHNKNKHPRMHTLNYICRFKLNWLSYPVYVRRRDWQQHLQEVLR